MNHITGETTSNYNAVFLDVTQILIPKKVEYNLRKYVSKTLLRDIDPDINIAIEKCLLLVSYLDTTYYSEEKWKRLSSTILHENLKKDKDNTYIYSKVLKVLKTGTPSKGPIIEVRTDIDGYENFEIGEYSKSYKLTDTYSKSGLVGYTLTDQSIVQRRRKQAFRQLDLANRNDICKNLIGIYQHIDLPTPEELLKVGKKLVKEGYKNSKGKRLTVRHRNANEHWVDYEERSFVEDNIELFKFLTTRGFMIPTIGDEKSGGRVVDSFTLMPAWIRREILINGQKLVELDYKCLHPNIATTLFAGKSEYITHDKVAEKASIDVKQVKIEHLSFFNKRWEDMYISPLFTYYSKNETGMMERIFRDKDKEGYKSTSAKMFRIEVGIMDDVIVQLNALGIYVIYVYDALMCMPDDQQVVADIMNKTVLKYGVKTTVK